MRTEEDKKIICALSDYAMAKVYLENLKAELEELKGRLLLTAAPKTTKYEPTGGGTGWDKPSPEEAAVMRKEADAERYQRKLKEYQEKKSFYERLDYSIEHLSGFRRELIERHGKYHESWKRISYDTRKEDSYCRREFNRAVRQLSGMMFGPKAAPVQQWLDFSKTLKP